MAKDPAFLFYPGDWQGGTSTFSRFLKGCYLDVLIAQFNSGHLSLEEIKTVLGSDFGQAWPTLQKKFQKDAAGLFFNEKLDTEIVRRKEYSKSRSDNRKGKTHVKDMNNISETYVRHMETGNETEDAIVIQDRGVQGGKELLDEYISEAFDEITLGNIKCTFPLHNVGNELLIFQLKVRAAPNDYKDHKVEGLRKAFISQLSKSKATNGNGNHTKTSTRPVVTDDGKGKTFGSWE